MPRAVSDVKHINWKFLEDPQLRFVFDFKDDYEERKAAASFNVEDDDEEAALHFFHLAEAATLAISDLSCAVGFSALLTTCFTTLGPHGSLARLILSLTRSNAANEDGSAYNIGWTFFTFGAFGH